MKENISNIEIIELLSNDIVELMQLYEECADDDFVKETIKYKITLYNKAIRIIKSKFDDEIIILESLKNKFHANIPVVLRFSNGNTEFYDDLERIPIKYNNRTISMMEMDQKLNIFLL